MPFRLLVEFLLLAFSCYFSFPFSVWAALTINDVSPTTINSPDDVITISATASGLSNSTQYLQVAFSREGLSPAQYLGITKNQNSEWYLYKSSPSLADFSAYFYSFTPVGSTWSGQIQAKFDTNDGDFFGPGNYVLKLFKYITSSTGTASNNTITVAVNVASPSGQTVAASESPPASPTILINLGSNFFLGEEFGIGMKLANFDPNQGYFLKFRAGTDENTLNKGQTKNGSAFFADNEIWSKFPLITTDNSGRWEGQIPGRIGEDKNPGQYFIRVRVRKKDSDTFYDSEGKNISLSSPPAVVSASQAGSIASQIKTASPVANLTKDTGLVFGTASATGPAFIPPDPKNPPSNSTGIIPTAAVLFFLGVILSLAALLSVKFKVWEKWLMKA